MDSGELEAGLREFWRRIEKQDFDDAKTRLMNVPQAGLGESMIGRHKENDVVGERHGVAEELSNLGPRRVGHDPVKTIFFWFKLNFEKVSAVFDFALEDNA